MIFWPRVRIRIGKEQQIPQICWFLQRVLLRWDGFAPGVGPALSALGFGSHIVLEGYQLGKRDTRTYLSISLFLI